MLDSPGEIANYHAQAAPGKWGGSWISVSVCVPRTPQCVAILKISLSVKTGLAAHGWFRAEVDMPAASVKCGVTQEPSVQCPESKMPCGDSLKQRAGLAEVFGLQGKHTVTRVNSTHLSTRGASLLCGPVMDISLHEP